MTPAQRILHEAADIVGGTRNDTHGTPENSFHCIAEFWAVYDKYARAQGPRAVADKMELLKIARSICGSPARDHFVDRAGYAALAGELV